VTDEPTPGEVALQKAGVPFTLPPPIEGARSLEEFAQKSSLRPHQVLKSLLLDIDGSANALLLLPGDREADFAALRRHFSVRSVRMADREVVEDVTGYRIGTVTPLALRSEGLPILIEESALAEPVVSLGTGRSGRHVRLSPADLVRAVGAIRGKFAK
jgi:Cys-tRNA(Pro) deacylase